MNFIRMHIYAFLWNSYYEARQNDAVYPWVRLFQAVSSHCMMTCSLPVGLRQGDPLASLILVQIGDSQQERRALRFDMESQAVRGCEVPFIYMHRFISSARRFKWTHCAMGRCQLMAGRSNVKLQLVWKKVDNPSGECTDLPNCTILSVFLSLPTHVSSRPPFPVNGWLCRVLDTQTSVTISFFAMMWHKPHNSVHSKKAK